MLINATHSEEIRVATISGNRLDDIDIELPNREQKKSNIYLGTISRVEPSLEAVFVNYGGNKHGFLPVKEIEKSYFLKSTNDPKSDLKKILKEGQELLIQVEKEERGNKGAALTTYISLAGCYLVLMANNPKAGGISRRIEGDERNDLREVLNALTIPDGMGVIIRTAGLGKKAADLQWDLDVLLQHWNAIKNAAGSLSAPCLLHQESNVIIRAIRDNLRPNIKEILIDDEDLYTQAKQYIEILRSDSKNIVKLYKNDVPLFTRFQIESQIEEAYHHEIRLPSGGSLVFDRTEALTAVDINSGQSTKGQNIENTALHTNLEAADEIARQLRIRDVGGLIVIDFIDMENIKHQREVENRLRAALENDRARVQTGRISKFGILEMSRQRLKASLGENTQVICSKCSGKGSIRTVESLSLSLLRLIEEEALKQNTKEVHAQLPIELCAFLANEKRNNIMALETRSNIRIVLIPNPHYIFPNYKINRIKNSPNAEYSSEREKSYALLNAPEESNNLNFDNKDSRARSEMAAVQQLRLSELDNFNNKPSILKRLWSSLFSQTEEITEQKTSQPLQNKQYKSTKSRSEQSHTLDRDRNDKDRSSKNYKNTRDSNSRSNNNQRRKRNEQQGVITTSNTDNTNNAYNKDNNKDKDKNKHSSNTRESRNLREEHLIRDEKADSLDTIISIHTEHDTSSKNKFNNKSRNRSRRRNRDRSANITNNSTLVTADLTEIPKESSVQSPIEQSAAQEIVIKKATDRIKITSAANMSKRSFHPKKKVPFATTKYANKHVEKKQPTDVFNIEHNDTHGNL
ncbi:MAG: Rne/Rng family ribonuclease [Gammaproteobacteria bacterium]|nr:Rne/Rng family ribonuclease [Gammaproteobacteria bacterium]